MYNLCTVFRLRTLKHWWFTGQSVMYIKYTVPKNLNHSIKTEPVSAGADAMVRVLYICLFNLDRYRRKWKPDIFSITRTYCGLRSIRDILGFYAEIQSIFWTVNLRCRTIGLYRVCSPRFHMANKLDDGDTLSHSLLNVPHSYMSVFRAVSYCQESSSAQYHTAPSQLTFLYPF